MSIQIGMMKQLTKLAMLLMLGASMSACAGFLGFGGDSWKEEVLLHDGSKIIVKRSLNYGGRHEIGQPSPIKEQTISFTLPNSNKTIQWSSEFSEDVGRANFNLLALHILNGTAYVVAEPNLCLSYNKWGRPNPPYVFFKYDGKEWQRIQIAEFPVEFKTLNVALYLGHQDVELMVKEGLVPPETIKRRNETLEYNYPQYKTILREPMKNYGNSCGEMVYDGKGGWIGVGWFKDKKSREACVDYCEQEKISSQYCPCATLFKGK